MQKETIHTEQAPAAIGPYAQAVRVGDLIYTAGQGGLIPEAGEMIEGGVEAQAEQTMKNLSAVLAAAGSDLAHVVKTNIYLRRITDFAAVNAVYASFFEGEYPARTTIATSALPIGALVEIEMVALVPRVEKVMDEKSKERKAKMAKGKDKGKKEKKEKKAKKDKKK